MEMDAVALPVQLLAALEEPCWHCPRSQLRGRDTMSWHYGELHFPTGSWGGEMSRQR